MPTRVLCSSAMRTRETWERVARSFEPEPEVSFERLLYLAPARELLERIRSEKDEAGPCLLVIAHNPGTEDLARTLSGSGDEKAWHRMRAKYPTGGLTTLAFDVDRWSELEPAAGELLRFVAPRDLGDVG